MDRVRLQRLKSDMQKLWDRRAAADLSSVRHEVAILWPGGGHHSQPAHANSGNGSIRYRRHQLDDAGYFRGHHKLMEAPRLSHRGWYETALRSQPHVFRRETPAAANAQQSTPFAQRYRGSLSRVDFPAALPKKTCSQPRVHSLLIPPKTPRFGRGSALTVF